MQRSNLFKSFHLQRCILYINIFLSLLSKANSSSTGTNDENEANERLTKPKSEETIFDALPENPAETIGLIFNGTIFIFILLSLYLICTVRRIVKKGEDKITPQVYKFIFLTNNGYIVVSLSLYFFVGNEGDEPLFLYFFSLEAWICLVGVACYIHKKCRNSGSNPTEDCISCDLLCDLLSLPCKYVWSLLPLTEDCCRCDTITETYYTDGSKSSDACIVVSFNLICKFLKIFSLAIGTLVYYIFYLILFISISFCILIKCCINKNENSGNANGVNPTNTNINNNYNYNNNIQVPYQQMQDNNIHTIELKNDYGQMNQENTNYYNNIGNNQIENVASQPNYNYGEGKQE